MSQEARACIDMCLQYAGEVFNNGPDLSLASDEQEKIVMQAFARAGEYYIEYLMEEGVVVQDKHEPRLFHLVDFSPIDIEAL